MRWVAVMLMALTAAACGNASPDAREDTFTTSSPPSDVPTDYAEGSPAGGYGSSDIVYGGFDEDFDEDRARETAEEELGTDTYVGASMAYGCTSDCTGHEAGWAYQSRGGYGAPYSGRSESFRQGRQAYDDAVDDRVEEMRQEFENARDDGEEFDY